MAIIDEHEQTTATEHVHYCPSCGEPVGNFRYCTNCGHAIPLPTATAGDGVGAEPPPAPPPAPPLAPPPAGAPSPERSGRTRILVISLAALLGLAAIAIAAVVLASGNSSRNSTAVSGADGVYRQKLTVALTPVVSANRALSVALGRWVARARPSRGQERSRQRPDRRLSPRRARSQSSPSRPTNSRSRNRSNWRSRRTTATCNGLIDARHTEWSSRQPSAAAVHRHAIRVRAAQ